MLTSRNLVHYLPHQTLTLLQDIAQCLMAAEGSYPASCSMLVTCATGSICSGRSADHATHVWRTQTCASLLLKAAGLWLLLAVFQAMHLHQEARAAWGARVHMHEQGHNR